MCFSGETSDVCGGGRGHMCVFQWRDKCCLWGQEGPYVCVFQWRDKHCLWGREGPYVCAKSLKQGEAKLDNCSTHRHAEDFFLILRQEGNRFNFNSFHLFRNVCAHACTAS